MRTGTMIARIFLGGIFVISGLNGFFHFIPSSAGFISSMINTGDLFFVVKFFEILCGAMILSGIFMPIALIMLFPITINIFMYHITTGMGSIPMSMMIMIVHIFMIYSHREKYIPMIHG